MMHGRHAPQMPRMRPFPMPRTDIHTHIYVDMYGGRCTGRSPHTMDAAKVQLFAAKAGLSSAAALRIMQRRVKTETPVKTIAMTGSAGSAEKTPVTKRRVPVTPEGPPKKKSPGAGAREVATYIHACIYVCR